MVKVPEPRLDPLIELYQAKKVTYSEIEYVDVVGGGGKGSGLGERVLTEARPCDCLVCVIDAFTGLNDPQEQFQAMEADFIVADLAVAEKKLERLALDKRKAKDLVNPKEEEAVSRAKEWLEAEKPLRADQELAAEPLLRGFAFLSAKPVLYVWNVGENALPDYKLPQDGNGVMHIAVSAKLERELAELDDPEEKAMFLSDLGIESSALDLVISRTYGLLGLISFLTAGEKEVRSWPVREGSTAPEAAGVIHTDFQKGFIRAEVLGYQDYLDCGDFKTAKERGVLRLEGKDYIVKDGDIIEFRFNV